MPDMQADDRFACRVWLAPHARHYCENVLRSALQDAEIVTLFDDENPLCGPATLLMHVDDLARDTAR